MKSEQDLAPAETPKPGLALLLGGVFVAWLLLWLTATHIVVKTLESAAARNMTEKISGTRHSDAQDHGRDWVLVTSAHRG